MSPRIIQIPLSGGDRKHLAKETRAAESAYHYLKAQEAQIREEIAGRERVADRLAAEAWNAALFLGARLEPQDTPTLGQVLNGGFDTIEVHCDRCNRASDVALGKLGRPPITFMARLEKLLKCEACSLETGRRQSAHIIKLKADAPGPEAPRRTAKR